MPSFFSICLSVIFFSVKKLLNFTSICIIYLLSHKEKEGKQIAHIMFRFRMAGSQMFFSKKDKFFKIIIVAVSTGFLILSTITTLAQELPAFPGAEGFGSKTPGGRGGRIIEVTTLEASGPGSLREACQAEGPRIIIFRVGGTIKLKKWITIGKPFITIAGQTAPGDGVCLRGAGLNIATHDVVVRGLRIRVGDARDGPVAANRDGISIANSIPNTVYNIIIDHCSVSWAIDENISTWYPCHDITFQWCMIGEALLDSLHPKGPHSRGMLIGDHAKRISIHHCLFAHNNRRNPLMKGDTATEVINNVMYNWGKACIHFGDLEGSGPQLANIVGNYCIRGPQSSGKKIVQFWQYVKAGTKVYVNGNVDVERGYPSDSVNDWEVVEYDDKGVFRSFDPALKPSGITTQNALRAYELVMEYAGAIRPSRDPVDERIVQSILSRTGKIIDSQDDVGGWLMYKNSLPPTDTDQDGIPDTWEIKHGLDSANPIDGNALAPSGYTYVEEYLNSLILRKRSLTSPKIMLIVN